MSKVVQTLRHLRGHCQTFFTHYALTANVGTSVSLLGLGDFLEQRLNDRTRVDWGRVAKMSLVGFIFGPMNHFWYTFLDRVVKGRTLKIVVCKVLTDQLVFAPPMICSFFMTICTLEGTPMKESAREVRLKFWPTYMADWSLWPAAQIINFSLVPNRFRVLYVNVVTLGWNTFLSYMRHSSVNQEVNYGMD